ncbi:MAG: hypothetical protein ACP5I8_00685 [Phycisphaerae bacterium]
MQNVKQVEQQIDAAFHALGDFMVERGGFILELFELRVIDGRRFCTVHKPTGDLPELWLMKGKKKVRQLAPKEGGLNLPDDADKVVKQVAFSWSVLRRSLEQMNVHGAAFYNALKDARRWPGMTPDYAATIAKAMSDMRDAAVIVLDYFPSCLYSRPNDKHAYIDAVAAEEKQYDDVRRVLRGLAYIATDTVAAEPVGAAESERKALGTKEPERQAVKAYRLVVVTGKSQSEVATMMGTYQGKISRWVNKTTAWIKAGNVLPDIEGLHAKPISVDPAIIDMGERKDHLTKRQRGHRSDDSED